MDIKKVLRYFVPIMRANKRNKELETKLLIHDGDAKVVATELQVSKRMVNQIRSGERGKRKTTLAATVKKALNFRSKQNAEFVAYCNQIKVNLVIPQ